MNVVHVNQTDIHGGAARAAYRLHRSLQAASVYSTMLVCAKASDDETVQVTKQSLSLRLFNKVKKRMSSKRWAGFSSSDQFFHSTANFSSGMLSSLQKLPCDLVNLHWLGSDTLTIEEIARIKKPIVWTLHDMWAFCGAEHVTSDISSARFRSGYHKGNRPLDETGPDMNLWVWERKRKAWGKPMTIVCPSRWLAECARGSFLFRGWPVHCIPNTLDIQRWRPFSKEHSREFLGLPGEKQIILFGANGGEANLLKGGDLLRNALVALHKNGVCNIQLVIFGQSTPKVPATLPFPVTYLGRLYDDVSMVAAYNAADVMLVPSRQDNLPQTAVEAQACGTPVVAFNIGGLPDIIEHRVTGYLARPFEINDLVDGIAWVLGDKQRRWVLSEAARDSAVRKYSGPVIAKAYRELYERVLVGRD
ncbi:MAG: glycosyltransferase family 4 protein [Smithella sp.]